MLATEPEIEILRAGGAALAHSPIECLNILNAVPPIQRFRAAGIPVTLGCDNALNDLWETMRAVWLMKGTAYGLPTYDAAHVTEGEILAMATTEGARALGIDRQVGRIAVGMKADIIVLDDSGPHLGLRQNALAELVRYGTRAEVHAVMVDGRVVVAGGRCLTIDVAQLRADVRTTVEARRYQPITDHWRPMSCCGRPLMDGGQL